MQYILVVIILNLSGGGVSTVSYPFEGMEECFRAREMVIEKLQRPIINYQAVCIPKAIAG